MRGFKEPFNGFAIVGGGGGGGSRTAGWVLSMLVYGYREPGGGEDQVIASDRRDLVASC